MQVVSKMSLPLYDKHLPNQPEMFLIILSMIGWMSSLLSFLEVQRHAQIFKREIPYLTAEYLSKFFRHFLIHMNGVQSTFMKIDFSSLTTFQKKLESISSS
jgi:hypothetical protein